MLTPSPTPHIKRGGKPFDHPSPPLLQVPQKGKIYSINEGNSANWDVATKK